MLSARMLVCAALLTAAARAQPAAHRIIFDTDFALPPQDDGLALAFALNSPELDIVGITTVAGNYNVERANADALRLLEIAGRTDLRVRSWRELHRAAHRAALPGSRRRARIFPRCQHWRALATDSESASAFARAGPARRFGAWA